MQGCPNDAGYFKASPHPSAYAAKVALVGDVMVDSTHTPDSVTGEHSSSEFIYGAEEIARFLGISVRKVYYLTETRNRGEGRIPIKNLPSIGLCANRKALIDYLNGQRQV